MSVEFVEMRSENNYSCNSYISAVNNLLNRVLCLNCSAVTKQENAAERGSRVELFNFFAFIIWRIITLMPSNVREKYSSFMDDCVSSF